MGVGKHSKLVVKGIGSQELYDKLLPGDVQRMAVLFKESYSKVRHVLVGRNYGDIRFVRCAEDLAAFYDRIDLTENVKKIINEHSNG